MSEYHQTQCLHCLDGMISTLTELERAITAQDHRWIGLCIQGITNDCCNAKMYLKLWSELEDPNDRRQRELEAFWASQEPEIYDPYTGQRIIF